MIVAVAACACASALPGHLHISALATCYTPWNSTRGLCSAAGSSPGQCLVFLGIRTFSSFGSFTTVVAFVPIPENLNCRKVTQTKNLKLDPEFPNDNIHSTPQHLQTHCSRAHLQNLQGPISRPNAARQVLGVSGLRLLLVVG